MTLDDFDAKILTELQANSSLTAEEVGLRVSLSASAVAKRLKRLHESGLIERCVAVLDLDLIGPSVTALVLCTFDPDGPIVRDKIGGCLRDRPEVSQIWILTGEVDIGLTILTRTLEECAQAIRKLQQDFPQLRNLKEHIATAQPKRSLAVPFSLAGLAIRGDG